MVQLYKEYLKVKFKPEDHAKVDEFLDRLQTSEETYKLLSIMMESVKSYEKNIEKLLPDGEEKDRCIKAGDNISDELIEVMYILMNLE